MPTLKTGYPREETPPVSDAEHTVMDGDDPPFTIGPGHLNLEEQPSTVRGPSRTSSPPAVRTNLIRTMLSTGAPRPAAPPSLPPSASPERNQTIEAIAAGGMGIVESVFDNVLLRRIARKTMRSGSDNDAELMQRFIEEAQITAQLDHPNIVPVHDLAAQVESGKAYFTMKLVDGETLGSVFRKLHARPFSGLELERVLRVFLKVCDAVSFAHSRGVVHRDLKPDNVMVGSHGQVYVMDWGVALLLRDRGGSSNDDDEQPISVAGTASVEQHGMLAGTIQYMAPEQAYGLVADQGPRTDVYGLGAILYVLLTGSSPHAATTPTEALRLARAGAVAAPETRPAWPTLPPGLCRITMKALSPAPIDRQPSVEALKHEIEAFLRGGGWFQVRSFPAGATIMAEGDAADAAFVLTQGVCEVYREVDGQKSVVRRIGPGEIVGEMGLLTRAARTATVEALEPVQVMVITPEALEHELSHSVWLRELVRALATRFRELDQAAAHDSKSEPR